MTIFSSAVLMATYVTVFGILLYFSTRNGRQVSRPKGLDLALLTIASYKLSRVIALSFIGAPVQAPFTKRGPSLRGGEVQDKARGEGLAKSDRKSRDEPVFFSVWLTTAFVFGYTLAPIAAADDFLHHAYRNLCEASL